MTREYEDMNDMGYLMIGGGGGWGGGGGMSMPFIDHVAELQRLTARQRKRSKKRQRREGGGGQRAGRGSGEPASKDGMPAKKKKKKGATGGRILPESLSRVYGEAQRHYMRAEYREALRLLNEVIRQAPTVPDPYQMMGQVTTAEREDGEGLEEGILHIVYRHA